jgi:hypothetical protein
MFISKEKVLIVKSMPGRLSDATSVATPKGLLFVSSRQLLLIENRFLRLISNINNILIYSVPVWNKAESIL